MAERSNPMSKEWQLSRHRRAERSYSMFKVRRVNLIQEKQQQLTDTCLNTFHLLFSSAVYEVDTMHFTWRAAEARRI